MARVIAITQFVFLAMGIFTLNVIMKVRVNPSVSGTGASTLSFYLSQYGAWLLVIPVLWMAYASISGSVRKGVFSESFVHGVGILLAAIIIGAYSYAIFIEN